MSILKVRGERPKSESRAVSRSNAVVEHRVLDMADYRRTLPPLLLLISVSELLSVAGQYKSKFLR